MNLNYYYFEKNNNYSIKVNFIKKNETTYNFEKMFIEDYSSDNIQNFSLGNKSYNDTNDIFLIINWEEYDDDILIKINNNNTQFYISEITKNQSENLIEEFQNIELQKLENLTILKPENCSYEVLMIEINENEVEIEFEVKPPKKDPQDNQDNNNNNSDETLKIIIICSICIFGFINYNFFSYKTY